MSSIGGLDRIAMQTGAGVDDRVAFQDTRGKGEVEHGRQRQQEEQVP